MFRSCDHFQPIRGQYQGHVITLDQSELQPHLVAGVAGGVGHVGHVGHVHHLGVGEEHVAGVGAPRVHLHTVCLPDFLERLLHLQHY